MPGDTCKKSTRTHGRTDTEENVNTPPRSWRNLGRQNRAGSPDYWFQNCRPLTTEALTAAHLLWQYTDASDERGVTKVHSCLSVSACKIKPGFDSAAWRTCVILRRGLEHTLTHFTMVTA